MSKYLVGSKLLRLSHASDIDYITFEPTDISDPTDYYDIHYIDPNVLLSYLYFKVPFTFDRTCSILRYLWQYQYDYHIIGQNFPIKYDMLMYRKNYIELLNYIFDIGECNVYYPSEFCHKLTYHIAYMLFIIQNNDTLLTQEQFGIVQKIHDKKMPHDYIYELRRMVKAL